jgi:hypothetical protein
MSHEIVRRHVTARKHVNVKKQGTPSHLSLVVPATGYMCASVQHQWPSNVPNNIIPLSHLSPPPPALVCPHLSLVVPATACMYASVQRQWPWLGSGSASQMIQVPSLASALLLISRGPAGI